MPAIVSLFIGAALALHFRFLVLVPVSILVLLVTLIFLIVMGYGSWTIVLSLIAAVSALQAGYLGGSMLTPYYRRRNEQSGERRTPTKSE
jgi:hypothetical protein